MPLTGKQMGVVAIIALIVYIGASRVEAMMSK